MLMKEIKFLMTIPTMKYQQDLSMTIIHKLTNMMKFPLVLADILASVIISNNKRVKNQVPQNKKFELWSDRATNCVESHFILKTA